MTLKIALWIPIGKKAKALPFESKGFPRMYLGMTCAPLRVAKVTLAATLDNSQEISQPEFPIPRISTFLSANFSGVL